MSKEKYWEGKQYAFFSHKDCEYFPCHKTNDPEIFLTAAEKLQTPSKQCLILEDSLNGIRAAKAAGAWSCMVPDLTPAVDEIRPFCDIICEDLSQVIPYLDSCGSFLQSP